MRVASAKAIYDAGDVERGGEEERETLHLLIREIKYPTYGTHARCVLFLMYFF